MLGRRNKFVHQIVMTYRLQPFLRDVIFMIFWQSRFQTISRGFSWQCLELLPFLVHCGFRIWNFHNAGASE